MWGSSRFIILSSFPDTHAQVYWKTSDATSSSLFNYTISLNSQWNNTTRCICTLFMELVEVLKFFEDIDYFSFLSGMRWSDVTIEYSEDVHTMTYDDLALHILNGNIPHCHIDTNIFKCLSLKTRHGVSSKDFKEENGSIGGPHTNIIEKYKTFGMLYFSIVLEHQVPCQSCEATNFESEAKPSECSPKNAFAILMEKKQDVPEKIKSPANQKDGLFNDVYDFVYSTMKCRLSSTHSSLCKSFLQKLTDLCWYIDGHTKTIEQRSTLRFPDFISKFCGYNCPQKSKHRKRELGNMKNDKLCSLNHSLREVITCFPSALKSSEWLQLLQDCTKITEVIEQYCIFLREQNKKMFQVHRTPQSSIEDKVNITILPLNRGAVPSEIREINETLKKSPCFAPISVREHIPPDKSRMQISRIISDKIKLHGFDSPAVHYALYPGGSKMALHFVWRFDDENESELLNKHHKVITKLTNEYPSFERRITKQVFHNAYGKVASSDALRSIFQDLTGDQSAASNLSQKEADERFQFALLSAEDELLDDIREAQCDTDGKYEVFFHRS